MRTNVDGLRSVLEGCRAMATPPVVIFTSSLAVYGADPAIGPIGTVDEDTLPRPQSSYGIQKFVGEQLVADYTRKGFLRGRSVRLMTVTVRPGRPNAAASSFISGIIREPLAGERTNCPVPEETAIAVSSPARTIEGILRASEVPDATWGSRTAMNLPALTTTPREMLDSLERVAGAEARRLVDWQVDQSILSIVGSWPSRLHTPRAAALGLAAEESFDAIVEEYVRTTSAHPAS
jgi:nucleoside-diphosphate-sugar epimerase